MDTDHHADIERMEALFKRVVSLGPRQQDAVLEKHGANDPELAHAVRQLLEAHRTHPARSTTAPDAAQASHGTPSAGQASRVSDSAASANSLRPGALIGRFEIVRLIGGGSAAEVFEARRVGPVAQRVALKILRPGMGSIDLLARFEDERERLAQLDHPGIATLVDAGAMPDGRPWFAMLFVDGSPITRYCDDRDLSVADRIGLLRQVSEALAYAHRRSIVHRDLTPSNILVTEVDGRPRAVVVDFGIAKALSQPRRVDSELHLHRKILGTPAYMAPEQTRPGAPLGPPADVFGLGSLMAELLAGSTPLDIESLETPALDQVFADVRSRERPSLGAILRRQPPAARVAIAQHRGTTLQKLSRLLDGELQWIASHCLELDPDRRYESAEPLGEDLSRWLRDEPPSVGPRSALIRLRSLARRHRLAVGVVLFVVLTLTAATVVSTRFALSERSARRLADQRETTAQLIADFQAEILRQLDPQEAGRAMARRLTDKLRESLGANGVAEAEIDRSVVEFESALAAINTADAARKLVRESILEPAIAEIDRRFADQPLIAARLLESVANTYTRLGMAEETLAVQSRIVDLLERTLGRTEGRTMQALGEYAIGLINARRAAEADVILVGAVDALRQDPAATPEAIIQTTRLYAFSLASNQRFADAEAETTRALSTSMATLGPDHIESISCRHQLGQLAVATGRMDEAERHLLDSLADCERTQGPDHAQTVLMRMDLGYFYERKHDFALAEELYRRAWTSRRQLFGDDHYLTWSSAASVANTFIGRGRLDDAEDIYLPLAERILLDGSMYNEHADGVIKSLAALYDLMHEARPDEGFDRRAAAWRAVNELWRNDRRRPPPAPVFEDTPAPAP